MPIMRMADDDMVIERLFHSFPDEVADAGAADQHFGSDDHEPGDANRNPHAGKDGRRRRRQNHVKARRSGADFERSRRTLIHSLAHGGDAERGIEQHRPYRTDEDHEDRGQPES